MKKSIHKKLVLKKHNVAKLDGDKMDGIYGGRTAVSCDPDCVSTPYLCPSDPGYPSCANTCQQTCANTCQQTCNLSQCIGSCYWKCPTWGPDCM